MLFLIEVLYSRTSRFILTKCVLILPNIELGLLVPELAFKYIHCEYEKLEM
jgi:hypothetical protein